MRRSAAPPRGFSLLISGDRPGHGLASALVLMLLAALAVAPFLFPGTRALTAAAHICIFVVLAASYDILLGYTGIVSFAHTVFFAVGAYGVAIPLANGWVGWGAVLAGILAAVLVAMAVAACIGLLGLRVRALYFSMITLAVASFAQLLATRWRGVTGGEDGLTFAVPRLLSPAFRLLSEPLFGLRVDGRVVGYYLTFLTSLALFLLMLRVVNAPFGRVLQAIRENPFRAEALGYRIVVYRTLAGVIAAAIAAIAGSLMALLSRYTGPEATLSFGVMVDILLMVVIGGMGTLYGPALGAAVIVLAQYYLQPGLQAGADLFAGVPVLAALFQPDRWLLWLGVLFVLIVYFFPSGIVGSLRRARR
jgi:branched-chain amino acid transport system permease protein